MFKKQLALILSIALACIPAGAHTIAATHIAKPNTYDVVKEKSKKFVKSLLYFASAYGIHKFAKTTPWAIRWIGELNALVFATSALENSFRAWQELGEKNAAIPKEFFEPHELEAIGNLLKSLILFGATNEAHKYAKAAPMLENVLCESIATILGIGSLYQTAKGYDKSLKAETKKTVEAWGIYAVFTLLIAAIESTNPKYR